MPVLDTLHELKHSLVGDECEQKPEGTHDRKEGWSDKIKDVLEGGEERRKREAEEERQRLEKEREEARRNVEEQRSLTGKIHDKLNGGKHKAELEEAEFQRLETKAQEERKKHEHMAGKLRDALDAPHELRQKVHELSHGVEQVEKRETEEQHHLSNKVKEMWKKAPEDEHHEQEVHHKVWTVKSSEEQQQRDEGWREKLRALTGNEQKVEKKKVERGWLMEKMNEMAGGGVKSEEREDRLDKTIDFIQEHLLGQGDQSDESALEQMKDAQIKGAIQLAYKQVTGREFPLKDKN